MAPAMERRGRERQGRGIPAVSGHGAVTNGAAPVWRRRGHGGAESSGVVGDVHGERVGAHVACGAAAGWRDPRAGACQGVEWGRRSGWGR